MELGVLTSQERTQMTLPGMEEAVTRNAPLDAGPLIEAQTTDALGEATSAVPGVLGDSAVSEEPTVVELRQSRIESDAPYCFQCGVQMQRAGSCHACPSCGTTSGCS